jgi:hypothetical protein
MDAGTLSVAAQVGLSLVGVLALVAAVIALARRRKTRQAAAAQCTACDDAIPAASAEVDDVEPVPALLSTPTFDELKTFDMVRRRGDRVVTTDSVVNASGELTTALGATGYAFEQAAENTSRLGHAEVEAAVREYDIATQPKHLPKPNASSGFSTSVMIGAVTGSPIEAMLLGGSLSGGLVGEALRDIF